MFAAWFCMAALCSGVMELNLACAAAIASAFIVLVVVVVVVVVLEAKCFRRRTLATTTPTTTSAEGEWWVVLGSEQIGVRKPPNDAFENHPEPCGKNPNPECSKNDCGPRLYPP